MIFKNRNKRDCHKETLCIAILNKQKCHFIFLLQNFRTGGWNRSCLGVWYQWEGEDVGKGYRRVNMMCTVYTCM
jgi:hypothetical protein